MIYRDSKISIPPSSIAMYTKKHYNSAIPFMLLVAFIPKSEIASKAESAATQKASHVQSQSGSSPINQIQYTVKTDVLW